jgi:hypothetical protein
MNIIKLQDMLRGVPDDALIGYVQNPQGEVPSYLALSELQRRKDTRAKYQAEQAPETSVAEDLEQEATQGQGGLAMLAGQPQQDMAEQGVAGLPVDEGMYQEQNFVGGGIVAFEDGGDVKRFQGLDGSYVVPSKTPREYWQAIQGNKDLRKPFWYNQFETPYDEAIKFYQQEKTSATDPETKRQLDNALSELQMQKYKFARSKEDPTEKMMKTGMNDVDTGGKKLREPLTLKDLENKITGNNPPPPNPTEEVKEGATGQKQDEPIKTTESVEVTGDPFYFEERPENVAEAQRQRFKDMYGEDPFTKRGEERLSKMEARAKRMEDMAPGMAMLEAGLGIAAGSSPFALQNIGQGALAGVKSYGEAQNKLADLEEKRFNVDAKLADARRAVELAAMQHGFKSEEYNKAANDLKKTEILKGKLDIKKYETLAGTNETKMVMKQKQDLLRDRDKYLKDNWRVKNAIDVYNNENEFKKLNETQKKAVLQDVNTYNIYVQNLKLSYPLANMDLPTRDPIALLNRVR